MSKNAKIIILVLILVLIASGLFYFLNKNKEGTLVGGDKDEHGCIPSAGYSWCEAKNNCLRSWEEYCTSNPSKMFSFVCNDEKTITATFYPGDDKFVDLLLSDNRKISLPHAISASGARYAKEDESFVFWNKSDNAFITEGTENKETFSNCVLKTK